MKKPPFIITFQQSTFLFQDLLLLSLIVFMTLISPFFTWKGLRYDLFSSVMFFLFFNQSRYALLWATLLSFYMDTILAMPFGSTGLVILLIYVMSMLTQMLLKKKTFIIHWVTYMGLYLMALILKMMVIGFFLHLSYNTLMEIYSYVLTMSCYPILCSVLADITRYFKPKSK